METRLKIEASKWRGRIIRGLDSDEFAHTLENEKNEELKTS